MLTLNTGVAQGCMVSPLLYSLFTHDCMATYDSNTIIKFADETTVWCLDNNLSLNVSNAFEPIRCVVTKVGVVYRG